MGITVAPTQDQSTVSEVLHTAHVSRETID